MVIILYSLPVLGWAPYASIVFVLGPVNVSICRSTVGFFVSGQWNEYFQVSVLPSYDCAGRPGSSNSGRISTVPLRAGGTRAAMLIASFRSLASMM